MPYTSRICEQNRSLVVLIIDRSGSMNEPYGGVLKGGTMQGGGPLQSKAKVVADVSNMILMDLISKCRRGDVYKHYFDICAIGYSGRGVEPLLDGGRWFLSPAELASTSLRTTRTSRRINDLSGRLVTLYNSHKVWIEPYGEGDTPMYNTFCKLSELLYGWRHAQKSSTHFPPTIIHITDGDIPSDELSRVLGLREQILSLGSEDGEPLIFNFHLSTMGGESSFFPTCPKGLNTEARLLYELSSTLPPLYKAEIARIKNDTGIESKDYRAFSFNSPYADFINAMYIGTATTLQL